MSFLGSDLRQKLKDKSNVCTTRSVIEESWDFDSNYSHFADRNTKLFCCHGGKEFIAVQHSLVMTFDEY